MEKKMINRTGGCICGEIKFTVKLDEIPLVFNCHCIDCRKKLGGIMTIILLRDGAIDVDKSKLKIYEHSGGSGNKIKKHFCEKCAAPILTYVEKFKKYYLYAGLLDDISFLKKAENIHFKESHFPFLQIKDDDIKI